jgi:hypothetical protein
MRTVHGDLRRPIQPQLPSRDEHGRRSWECWRVSRNAARINIPAAARKCSLRAGEWWFGVGGRMQDCKNSRAGGEGGEMLRDGRGRVYGGRVYRGASVSGRPYTRTAGFSAKKGRVYECLECIDVGGGRAERGESRVESRRHEG